MIRFFSVVVLCLLAVPSQATAEGIRTEQVRFAAGASSASIRGEIEGYESVSYMVGAEAGQRMTVTLSPSNLATYFNVYAPGNGLGDAALANSSMTGANVPDLNRFDATLPSSGEYTISVYMMRSAARRGERSSYTLDIGISGTTGAVVEGDYADSLQGGPDFYAVRTSGGGLNLRAGPSSGAGVVTRVENGTDLRNLGCRMAEGRRWCRVAMLADPGYEGWAAGEFLVEGTGSAAAPVGQAGGTSTERVQFTAGAGGAELTGALAPGESRRYVLGAQSGQFLSVRVATGSPDVSYQIFNPDKSFLLDQIAARQEYRGQLCQSGDHVVEVINRGGGTADYNVIFSIE
ncbi:SH3 domain-containing protein [Defluviimonas salinarum]|uniref:SH3 domain-containing protein n=1 Tax=Defluviimonas salinarum TaxID=2992147 RepID=A0ABT3J5Y5_9RHOB|nr:SH3 domain-containing protein [Defluviimonas salinarum]MCW3783110.1 SH3 domain-containing protein [Defluviimonas salinarum]